MHTYPELYRKAYARYLRRGTTLDVSLKAAAHPTPYYIWRTRGDGKVRASHAENNGKIFAWDNPPPTGNPGEDYGCRCVAEPYVEGKSEYAYQTLTSVIADAPNKWTDYDLTRHFYLGGGRGVSLSEIGRKKGLINYYFYTLGKYNDVNAQIIDSARRHLGEEFSYSFSNSYGFRDYLYVFGGGVVDGIFVGTSDYQNGMIIVKGNVEYFYDDVFTDSLSIRELYDNDPRPEDMLWIEKITQFGGSYFPIKDYWKTKFYAEARLNWETSIYHWTQ
ncbi:MAG: phage minor head protein [Rickettsiales bacterium]